MMEKEILSRESKIVINENLTIFYFLKLILDEETQKYFIKTVVKDNLLFINSTHIQLCETQTAIDATIEYNVLSYTENHIFILVINNLLKKLKK